MFRDNSHWFDDWHFKNVDGLEISAHPLSPPQREGEEWSRGSGMYTLEEGWLTFRNPPGSGFRREG